MAKIDRKADRPSYYVKRTTSYGHGWTGPIRSARQAEREAQAWRNYGTAAEVLESTAHVRAQVREWEHSRRDIRSR